VCLLRLLLIIQAPGKVAPPNGSVGRYLVQNALNYIASEVHPNIGGLFYPGLAPDVQSLLKERAAKKLEYLENTVIGDRSFLVGDGFTIADSYLYIVLSWTGYVGVDVTPFPKVKAYFERIGNLQVVKDGHARIATNPASVF
jgi:glutathione S-transferase